MVDRIMVLQPEWEQKTDHSLSLCLYNLNTSTSANKLPVHYFTELLAEALGLKEEVQE